MATNPYFSQSVRSEQSLYEDIVIESLKMYGQDIYYLPRDIISEDRILGEDIPSRFNSSYKVEMYIENVDGFDGEGDLFTKFGVEIRDQATFIISRRRWSQTVHRYDNDITVSRPSEGDLLYIPFSKKLFEITHVEHEQPFYQLQNLPTYKLRCELFEYGNEDIVTGVEAIDDIQQDYAYAYQLTLDTTINQATATTLIDSSGVVTGINIVDSGDGYVVTPNVTITGSGGLSATATATIDNLGGVSGVTVTSSSAGFPSAPAITIASPNATNFEVNNVAEQILADGTTLFSRVSSWSDSDNILTVTQFGADDGKFHDPVVGRMYKDRSLNAGGKLISFTEDIQASETEQNDYFDTLTDFLDFSETNPFGEP